MLEVNAWGNDSPEIVVTNRFYQLPENLLNLKNTACNLLKHPTLAPRFSCCDKQIIVTGHKFLVQSMFF